MQREERVAGWIVPGLGHLLLRFIETHTFVRVGGNAPVQSDVRIIAASNNPDGRLAERVRPDLLYRLNSITVRIPPLPAATMRTAGGMMNSLGIGTTELSSAIRKIR